ncbi:MAG: P-loop NTPase fold protein [Syntrophales bacterium]
MWSDKETLYDCLGYSSYVNVLADVCIRQDLAPLTLGVFGAWGSGKTSLMAMLKYRLDQMGGTNKTRTLWFNAWKYEGCDEAQSALIHAILNKLTEGRTLAEDAKNVLGRLVKGASVLKLAGFITKTAITLTPDLTGFLDCFKEQSKEVAETMEQFDRDFEEFLRKVDVSQMVVFIDDLDRCPSTKVIETFETIKLFLNTPKCTFVIGADAQRIEQAVGEVYGVTDAGRKKDYIEKIVQLPFNIPVQNTQDIACYVGMLVVGRHLVSNDGWNAFIEQRAMMYQAGPQMCNTLVEWAKTNGMYLDSSAIVIERELTEILPYVSILGDGLRGNPRQIKRFLNILSLRRQLASANSLEVDDALVVKMTVVEYVWEDFFNALVDTVDPAAGHSPLVQELVGPESDEEKSGIVEEFAEKTHLVAFLKNDPSLTADVDLRPYLFLAQTSISRGKQTRLLPPDEKSESLAKSIAGKDRVMSKASALRAAAEDAGTVESVIRHLVNTLAGSTDNQVRTHILTGLDTICAKHNRFYSDVVKGLDQCDPGSSTALGIAGNTLLSNAERVGTTVTSDLKDRFAKAAGVLSALSGGRHSSPRRK